MKQAELKKAMLAVLNRSCFSRMDTAEHKQAASCVCRLRDNRAYEVLEERPVTEADHAAGILGAQNVRFPNGKDDADIIWGLVPHIRL